MAEKNNIRALLLDLLLEYELEGKYINLSLTSHKADRLSAEERGLLTALLYTTVENKLRYDYYISSLAKRSIEKIDVVTKNIIRIGLCQLLDMENLPQYAAINETVKLARNIGEKSFVNGILRSAQRSAKELPLPDKEKNFARYLSVKYSFPLWIVKKYIALYGEREAEELLMYFSKVAPTDLFVNTCKTSVSNFINKLSESGIFAEKSPLSENSVRIEKSVDPRKISGYSDGEFFVQDRACSAAISLLGCKAGESVVDVCSAPGGKSFAAAIFMNGEGRVTSFDIHESKLSLISDGSKRLSLSNVTATVCDGTKPKEELFDSFDKVICDVPCSGLGVLSKKPDLRYKSPDGLDKLPELQYEILSASAEYLKCGGRLLYSTCTLLPEENGEVVKRFLDSHPNFHTVDFYIGEEKSRDGCFTFIPHVHKTDGFFVSLLEKD